METTFRWRSWLGASVIFFLIFGVINVGLAIAVPATLHLNGSFPGVVFGAGDAQLLGRSFAGLRHDNPKLDMLLVDSMTSLLFSIPLFLGIIAGGIAFRRGLHAEVSRG